MADANVSQLEINGTTYDICDATARDSLSQYLPLTGGTISGNLLVESAISTNTLHVYNPNSTGHIETNKLTLWADTTNANYAGLYFKSFNENNQVNRNEPFIRCYGTGNSESSGGDALLIGNGGLTVVGGGEAATTTYDYYTTQTTSPLYPNSEILILASDNNMYFVTNANTAESIERLRLTGAGALIHNDSTIDLTKSNNNVTDTKSHSWSITDKNGNYLGWLEGHAYTNGTTALVCRVRNYGTGSAVSHGFTLGVGNDGTRTVTFDQPSAWREALNLDTANYENTASSICTAASGVTLNSVGAIKWGRVCMIAISFKFTTDLSVPANGNVTNRNVCTLKNKYLPSMSTGLWSTGDEAGAAWYNTDSGGVISLGACEGTGTARTITAGTNFAIRATYISSNWK